MSSPAQVAPNNQGAHPRPSPSLANDGAVLLDLEHDKLLKLNRVGVEIWKLLKTGESESQIVRKIAERYNVDENCVSSDVRALLQRISELGIAVESAVLSSEAPHTTQPGSGPSFPWYVQHAGKTTPKPRLVTVWAALVGLAAFDFILSAFSIKTLCSWVQGWRVRARKSVDSEVTGRVCAAVERACVWYPKRAVCLQRSAVTACLLRSHGIPARMTLGVRPLPFMAHAWVEVNGSIINDWPGIEKFYDSLSSH